MRQIAQTDTQGTSVLGIIDAASQLGMDAKGVKTNLTSLSLDTLPAIVHVIIGGKRSHFMMLHAITAQHVLVMDPADGRIRKIPVNGFLGIWTGVAILLCPNENFRPNKHTSPLVRIIKTARPQLRHLIAAGCCAVCISVISLILSLYVKEVVDEILPARRPELLNVLSGLVVTVLIIQLILNCIKGRIVIWVSREINASLILTYYRHIMTLPGKFFDNMRTGDIVSRVNDAAKISVFVNELFVHLTVDVLVVVMSVIFMFAYNWHIALLVGSIVPVYAILYAVNHGINKKWQKTIAESAADFEAHLIETIGSAKTIKNLGADEYFVNKTASKLKHLLNRLFRHSTKQSIIGSSADFSTKLFTVLLIWIGSYYILNDRLTMGELMAFYSLMASFSAPVLNLIDANRTYGEAKVAAERLFEIFDLKPAEGGWKKINQLHDGCLAVELKGVQFRYGNADLILTNINRRIRKGSITGIKGKSGSGKSTLAALFLGAYPPTAGSIKLFGTELNELDSKCLPDLVSIAQQHVDLFNVSIKENITIGRDLHADRLNDLAERLGITEFAQALPNGMDTLITERGQNLSGGQRQRIAIARAMYRQSPILILDEATSALDADGELKIMQTIEWYRSPGNTVIIIAHNTTTLKICDNIAVLNNGGIR